MAKKNDESVGVATTEENDSLRESTRDAINKKFGIDVLITGADLAKTRGRVWSTGLIGFDIAFSGGIQEGTLIHIGGLPKVGKTTLSLTIAAGAQAAGKNVYYIDAENRLQDNLLSKIDGLNKEKLMIIKTSPEKPFLTAEETLTIIDNLVESDPGCLIILDSLASLCSEEDFTKELTESSRATLPKIMSRFLRKTAPAISVQKSNMITLTHMQANPTGYGPTHKEIGGYGVQYYASYWLNCFKTEKVDAGGKQIGKDAYFKINAVAGGPPDAEPIAYIRYDRGCDKYLDLVNNAESFGLIQKGGAWYSIDLPSEKEGDKPKKYQGKDNLCNALRENSKLYEELLLQVKRIAGI
jgi:protein RecA